MARTLWVRLQRAALACFAIVGATAADAATYANGFPSDRNFFPIGVWLQSTANAAEFAAIGVNTYIGLANGPTEEQLADLARNNMFAVAEQNEVGLRSRNASVIRAWLLPDEPDNAQPLGPGKWGPCIAATDVVKMTRERLAKDATRPVYINFGRGVAIANWPGRGSCTGDTTYYDAAIRGAGILSFDVYPVAGSDSSAELENVAAGTANLERRVRDDQRVWAVIETTKIQSQNRVTPEQLRSEVWMALIRGATGLVYFVHEWTGGFREDAIFRYPEIVGAVKDIDATLSSLAPLLNAPSVDMKVAVASAEPIATMVKQQDNVTYLFSIDLRDQPTTVKFAIDGLRGGSAAVIGEGRSIPVTDGWFEDSFGAYGVHNYAIMAKPKP